MTRIFAIIAFLFALCDMVLYAARSTLSCGRDCNFSRGRVGTGSLGALDCFRQLLQLEVGRCDPLHRVLF